MKLESVRKQIDDYFENTPLEKIQAAWNKYHNKVTSPKIGFGPEYGINPPDIGIEEFRYFGRVADPRFSGTFIIRYRNTKTGHTTSVAVSPNDLVNSGVLDLDKLKEFLK
jgi:hypothetical protein